MCNYMKKIYLGSKRLMLLALSFMLLNYVHAQIQVSGTVIDGIYGGGLPGANVVLKGTTKGTSTDLDGKFSISVPDNSAVLVFSFAGYEPQEITVGSRTTIDLTLKQAVKQIEEVVKVGYGVQKKTDVTGAVSQIGGDDLADRPVVGVDQAMQGKAAGVQVTSNSGSPGGSSSVSIRGIGTINNADPLYVIDGIPQGSTPKINPSEIKSISVLKDASACAIYGSRAANGVIIVTTREGKMGKKSKDCEGSTSSELSFDAMYGVSSPWKYIDLTNANEFVKVYRENGNTSPFDGAMPAYIDTVGEGTDWQREIMKPAPMQRYTLGWETGSENSSVRISASYLNQEGIVKYTGYEQLSLGGKGTHQMKKWLTIRETFGFSSDERRTTQDGTNFYGNIIAQSLTADPTIPVTDESKVTELNPNGYVEGVYNNINNPAATLEYECKNQKNRSLGANGTFATDISIFKGLSLTSLFGANQYNSVYSNYVPAYYVNLVQSKPTNQFTENTSKGWGYNWTTTLTYTKDFMSRNDSTQVAHSISGMVGHEVNYSFNNQNNFNAYSLKSRADVYPHLSLRDTVVSTGAASDETMVSELFRFNYGFKNRYLATINFRIDRSSRFKKENQTGYFPSLSLGWKISDEPFFKNNEKLKIFNELKLRAGWGQIGNQNISADVVQPQPIRYENRSYSFNGRQVTGASGGAIGSGGNQVPNPDVRWETTEQYNIGLDMAIWRNKVLFTLDYFRKKTYDMLVPVTLPMVAGAEINYGTSAPTSSTVNAGSIKNNGFEASLSYRGEVQVKQKLTYEIGGNFTHVVNNVANLESETGITSPEINGKFGKEKTSLTFEGYPMAQFYGYQYEGVYHTWEEINEGPRYSYDVRPGDFKFKDVNGDGIINNNDKVFIGSPLPKFTYGFFLSGGYWIFDYNISFQGSYGNKILNLMRLYNQGNTSYNYSVDRLNAWSEKNTSSDEPRYGNDAMNYDISINSKYVESGSYLRLKDVTLGATMPESLTKKIKINKLRVYGQVSNLFTWTKYSGSDPEIGRTANSEGTPEIGVDYGVYPQALTVTCGLNFSF